MVTLMSCMELPAFCRQAKEHLTCDDVAQSDWKQIIPQKLRNRDISAHHHAHGDDEHVCHAMLQAGYPHSESIGPPGFDHPT